MPWNPTYEATAGAEARLHAPSFGLTERAMRFAQLYAKYPSFGPTHCARQAGYSDKGGAASVRGAELLRDPRVLRAVLYFGRLAFIAAQADATARLHRRAEEDRSFGYHNRWNMRLMSGAVHDLAMRAERLDVVFGALLAGADW